MQIDSTRDYVHTKLENEIRQKQNTVTINKQHLVN